MRATVPGLRRWTVTGFVGLGALAALLLGWFGTARLESAVVATAALAVADDAPPVQHPYGGQVAQVLVRDGDTVEAGQPLLTFDTAELEDQLDAARLEADILRIRVARLDAAVADEETVPVPEDLALPTDHPSVTQAIAAAQAQLDSWRSVLDAQVLQVRRQPGVTPAYRDAQVAALRAAAELEAETERGPTLDELSTVEQRLGTITQQLARAEVTAPSSGVVYGTQRLQAGRVVQAGETMMYIARDADDLVARAQVAPDDIAAVTLGGTARVQLLGVDAASAPAVAGTVSYVSPEPLTDETTGTSHYAVTLDLAGDDLAEVRRDVRLMTGMPATAFVTTGERTALDYLLGPALDRLRHAMREP